jgi:hypothetical protein
MMYLPVIIFLRMSDLGSADDFGTPLGESVSSIHA